VADKPPKGARSAVSTINRLLRLLWDRRWNIFPRRHQPWSSSICPWQTFMLLAILW